MNYDRKCGWGDSNSHVRSTNGSRPSASTCSATPAKVKPRGVAARHGSREAFQLTDGGSRATIRTTPVDLREYISESFAKRQFERNSPELLSFPKVSKFWAVFVLHKFVKRCTVRFLPPSDVVFDIRCRDHTTNLSCLQPGICDRISYGSVVLSEHMKHSFSDRPLWQLPFLAGGGSRIAVALWSRQHRSHLGQIGHGLFGLVQFTVDILKNVQNCLVWHCFPLPQGVKML